MFPLADKVFKCYSKYVAYIGTVQTIATMFH